ncbi:MAG TPA: DoxX family protein [Minicystis sp.]|nr:DoxX family protein [Minicystis sp.]
MPAIHDARAAKRSFFEHVAWLSPLLARLLLAAVFIPAGYGKLTHIETPIRYFTHLGIPDPVFMAWLVGTCELVCGALLLIGLVARLATVPLIVTMIVALATAKAPSIHGVGDLIGTSEFLYLLLLVMIAVMGAGLVSLDHLVEERAFGGRRAGLST